MNILRKLDTKHFSNISEIMDSYDEKIKNWKEHVTLDQKNIVKANVEQASWLAYYDEVRVELRTLIDFLEMKVKEKRGKVAQYIIDKSEQDHTERTRERMIDCDPDYIKLQTFYLLVKEQYNLVDSIVNQFKDRAFVLNNITKIFVAELQGRTLYIDEK